MKAESVFITGASRGIGLELVSQILRLPKAPRWLFAGCRNPEQATELQKLAASSPSLKITKLDVTSAEDIQAAVKSVDNAVGERGLNLLINNAGYQTQCVLDDVTADMMTEHFRVNSVSPLMVCKAFLPLLRKAASRSCSKRMGVNKAAIVNISTILASIELNNGGPPLSGGLIPYRASKTALNQITRNLSIELKPLGILAMVLHPGWVRTLMGGPNADLSTTESVTSMMRVLGELNEEDNGTLLNYDGTPIPW